MKNPRVEKKAGCRIRAVKEDDAKDIASILNRIIEAGKFTVLEGPISVDNEREYIRKFPNTGIFNVAECGLTRKILGFQSLEPFAAYTSAFRHVGTIGTFIDIERLGSGIGSMLALRTFEMAKGLGYEKILTYVRSDNIGSLAWHLKMGFRIIGTAQKQVKLNGRYGDEIFIEKFL
jgi:L-amino acid N-acyltransferase YncA